MPLRHRCTGEHHVVAVADGAVCIDRPDVLFDGKALPGQCSFGGMQRNGLDQASIGRNAVSFFKEDDVTRNDLRCGYDPGRPISDDSGLVGSHAAQGC